MIPNKSLYFLIELPDLQAKIQSGIVQHLQEGDIQIRGLN
jgi:hypothetical protein